MSWQTLFDEELIRRLGWTLLHTLWLGVAWGGLVALLMAALRRRSAQARYVMSGTALAGFMGSVVAAFVWLSMGSVGTLPVRPTVVAAPENVGGTSFILPPPLAGTPVPADADNPTAPTSPVVITDSQAQAAAVPVTSSKSIWDIVGRTLEPAFPWMVLAWALGVCALALWQFAGWLAVRRLQRLAVHPANTHLMALAERLARKLGVRQAVLLLESALVRVPTVIGWLRPVILLPMGMATGLSPAQVEAILVHELGHIRRHDYLVNLLQSLVETLLFYHPATWYISRRIRRERENCCDDIVVALGVNQHSYAESLLHLAQRSAVCRDLALGMAAAGKPSELRSRVGRLLGVPEDTSRLARSWPVVLVTGLLVTALSLAMTLRAQSPATTPASAQPTKTPTKLEQILTTWPAPKLDNLAERSAPAYQGPMVGDSFYDLLKLRETRDPMAVPVLGKVLESNAHTTRTHGFAAAQALFMIGGREANDWLAKYTSEDQLPSELQTFYTYYWDMPEPQRSLFLEQYVLKNLSSDLTVTLQSAPGKIPDELQFTIHVKNVTPKPLSILDKQVFLANMLYLRTPAGYARRYDCVEYKPPILKYLRLQPGEERQYAITAKRSYADAVRGKDPYVTPDIAYILETHDIRFYLPKGEVRATALFAARSLTAEQRRTIDPANTDDAWSGRAVSATIPIKLFNAAAPLAPTTTATPPTTTRNANSTQPSPAQWNRITQNGFTPAVTTASQTVLKHVNTLVTQALAAQPVDEKALLQALEPVIQIEAFYAAEGNNRNEPSSPDSLVRLVRNAPGKVPQEWLDSLKAPLAKRPKVSITLLFGVPADLRAQRDAAITQADKDLRNGFLKIAAKFPFMKDKTSSISIDVQSPIAQGYLIFSATHLNGISKAADPTANIPPEETYSIRAALQPPRDKLGQLEMSPLYPCLGLEGQCSVSAVNPDLHTQLRKLLDTSLAPLTALDDIAARSLAAKLNLPLKEAPAALPPLTSPHANLTAMDDRIRMEINGMTFDVNATNVVGKMSGGITSAVQRESLTSNDVNITMTPGKIEFARPDKTYTVSLEDGQIVLKVSGEDATLRCQKMEMQFTDDKIVAQAGTLSTTTTNPR